ncbi:hypothetical protein PSA01_34430 [Pseudonocardia saturnea]|uniref:Uncharacterized protein n=1 Tax=Pseudonocardia saturnea TaxID=33909 RepID=A0ABQ0S0J3_9PSEU|nr:hypothetical protein PSA01_34430 [Pseudonocardia saturnea]
MSAHRRLGYASASVRWNVAPQLAHCAAVGRYTRLQIIRSGTVVTRHGVGGAEVRIAPVRRNADVAWRPDVPASVWSWASRMARWCACRCEPPLRCSPVEIVP